MSKTFLKGRWSKDEKSRFLQAISTKDYCWSQVSELVVTRSSLQCRSHYQKLKKSPSFSSEPLSKKTKPKFQVSFELKTNTVGIQYCETEASTPVSQMPVSPVIENIIPEEDALAYLQNESFLEFELYNF